jgi:hypothetical protein
MDKRPFRGESLKARSDIAKGGIMTILGGRGKTSQTNCPHSTTIAVISAGVERIVCESCGNVSFVFRDDMTVEINRDMFARTIDQLHAEVTVGVSA